MLSNSNHPYPKVFPEAIRPANRRRNHHRAQSRRLVFEALESRQLLSADLVARFEFANTAGEVISSLDVGQDFELRLYVYDNRTVPRGVFQAYFDVSYSSDLVAVTGDVVHGENFSAPGTVSGDTSTPGLIDEAGGRDTDQFPPTPANSEFDLFSVPMRTLAAGTLNLTLDLADRPDRIVQFFDTVTALPLNKVDVRNNSIAIVTGGTTSVAITAADAVKFEGNSGTTPFTFTVTRSGLTTGTTTINWAVTGSGTTPANAADFGGTLPSGQISFAPGETSKTISVNVSGDTVVEPDEQFTVTLSNASGGSQITTATATGTILNDDIRLDIAATDADKFEGNSGTTPFTFSVTRSGLTTGTTTVNWAVTGSGTNPANAADFGGTLPSGQISFAPGQTSRTLTVNVSGDTVVEADEEFTVTLSNASGNAQIGGRTATGTIRNDDIRLDIAATDAIKFEGDSGTTPFTFSVTRSGLTTGTTTVNWAVTGSGPHPANAADFGGTLPSGQISFAPGQTSRTLTVNVSGDTVAEPDEEFTVTLSNASGNAQIGGRTATGTIRNDDPATFVVTSLSATASGFVVDFNEPFHPDVLNLYDSANGTLGPADITLVGAAGGPVRGSAVVRADNQQLTFIKTGGPLEPDSYTVTLRSAADGFVDAAGNLLDGNRSGIAGNNFVDSFVVASRPANEVTVSIPDFARGFGQAVNLPDENASGIPVTLSTGQNVTSASLDLVFDPTLLNVTSFSNSVAGATSSFSLVAPGRMRVTVTSASPFRSTPGPIELGRFVASVPPTAPYAAKQILRLENVTVEDAVPQARPVRADHGLHVAAFVGDSNASRTYTGGDATLLQRLVVGQGTGFAAYQLTDPLLIADVNRSDTLTGGDATLLQRIIVGTPITQAPPPPTGITPPDVVGPDPRLFIPTDLTGKAGDTVTVPVMLEVTEPAGISVAAVDLAIAYNPEIFTVSNFVRGALLDGFGFSAPIVNTAAPGILRVTMASAEGPELAFGVTGAVFQFEVTVAAEAPEGISRLNLLQNFESTFTGIENNDIEPLTLIPAPTNADNDPVDGVFTITSLPVELSIAATDAVKLEGDTGSTPFTFTVTRTGNTSQAVSVQYTAAGTGPHPANAADFAGNQLPNGTVHFAANETVKTIIIDVRGDTTVEPDESFSVTLSNASSGARIETATAVGTILNDDEAAIDISGPPPTEEGDVGTTLVEFTVTLSAPVDVPVSVDYATVDGSAEDELGDHDYQSAQGTLTFLPGDSLVQTVTVAIIGDTVPELDETFQVVLSNLRAGTPARDVSLGNAVATATIIDDDAARLTIVVTQDAEENKTDGLFTISADRPLAEPVEVWLEISGTATPDADYVAIDTTLTFPADVTSVTIPVIVLSDDLVEGDETVIVRIVGTSALLARPGVPDSATLIIVDANATTVSIEAGDAPAAEPATDGQFVIRLGGNEVAPPQGITVTYTISGSATPGEDYEVLPGSVTILAGQNSVLIPVVVLDDDIVEPTETVIVTLLGTDNPGATIDPDNHTATVLIEDNDTASVSIAKVNDGAEAETPVDGRFRVTQSRVSTADTVISYTVSGTATPGAGNDYLPLSGTVTIAAGTTTADIVVTVLNDDIVEGTETVIVTLDTITAGLPAISLDAEQQTAVVEILDNDEATVAIVKVRDGAEGDPPVDGKFRVTQTKPGSADTVLTYTVGGTATPGPGNDYLPLSGTVTIAAGQTSADIVVTVLNDALIEPDETVIVTLDEITSGVSGVTIDQENNTATVTIADEISSVSITAVNAIVSEPGPGDAYFAVMLDGDRTAPPGGIQVSYTVAGTATPGADYVVLPGVVTIPAGQSSATIPVTVLDDEIVELPETIVVTLTMTDFASVIADPDSHTATVTIEDDDSTTVSLTVSDDRVSERGGGRVDFTVTLDEGKIAPPDGITISYAVNGTATAGADYTALSGSVTIPGGQSSAVIPLIVLDDEIVELDETVIITLTGTNHPGATINPEADTATVTIEDDDQTTVSIIANLPNAAEPDVNGQFTVRLDNGKIAPPGGIVVSYTTSGTATPGLDFTALPGTVTIPAGASSATIPVGVLDDEIVELDETVIVTLTGTDHPGATINPLAETAAVTIADDDQTTVSIIASLSNAAEPNVDGEFTVRLDNGKVAPPGGIVVSYTTSGTATPGLDFTALPGTVTIPAGASAATIPVGVLDDEIVELDETVIVTLTGTDHPGATVNPLADTATVTIADDDQTTVSIIASLPNAAEPNVNGQFTVRLDNGKVAPPGGIVVSYTTSGTATAGLDFTALPGTVTIPAGASAATIPVAVLDDEIVELDETVIVTLTGTDHLRVSVSAPGSTATVTIADDDQTTVSMIASLPNAAEPNVNGQFTVRLDNGKVAPPGGIVVSYTTSGTATAGLDYTTLPGTVTIPGGASAATIPVAVLDDEIVELDETVIVTLTGTDHPRVSVSAPGGTATVTIEDDDQTTVSIIASDPHAAEPDDHGEFTVRLDNNKLAPPGGIVVTYTTGGTATPGSDYIPLPGNVTILAGQSSAVIPVNVINDSTPDEPAETVVVTLTAANHPGVSLSTANRSATVTIAEDDPRNATISGIVWADANNDGQQQKDGNGNPLEPGIPGVIVRLSGTARNGTQFELQAMTDSNGAYRFVDLPAGTYEVRQEQPPAWIDGRESLASSTSNDTYSNIVLEPSQQAGNYSFGERGLQPQFISKRHFLASTPPNDVYFRELNALAMQLAGDAAMAQAIRDASIPSVVSAKNVAGSILAAQNAAPQADGESSPVPSIVWPAEGEASSTRPAMFDAWSSPPPSVVSPAEESRPALSAVPPAKRESNPHQAAAPASTTALVPGGEGEALTSVAVPSTPLWSTPSNSESPSSRTPAGIKPRGGQQRVSSVARPDRTPKYAHFPDSDLIGRLETARAVNRNAHDASSTSETTRGAVDGHFAAIAGEGTERGSSRPSPAARYRGMHGHRTDDKLDLAMIVDVAFAEDNWLDGLE